MILGDPSDEALNKLIDAGVVDLVRFGKSKYLTIESIDRLIRSRRRDLLAATKPESVKARGAPQDERAAVRASKWGPCGPFQAASTD